jgi:hypothetical protein
MTPKLSDLWRFSGPLDRSAYLLWGLLLAGLKWNLDRWVIRIFFNHSQPPETLIKLYLWQWPWIPREHPYSLTLLALSVPFLWAGALLTLRRLRSLAWRPFWVLLLCVPIVKFLFFAILCILPSKASPPEPPTPTGTLDRWLARVLPKNTLSSALVSITLSALITLAVSWFGSTFLRDYGWSLFVGLPFAMGFLSSLIHSFQSPITLRTSLCVANATVTLAGLLLLLTAVEGLLCLVMCAPVGLAMASIGGLLAHTVQRSFWWRPESPKLLCSVLLLLPSSMTLEHVAPPPLPLLSVTTAVTVNAPPEKVWPHVVAFPELPPPTELLFKLGIAYPIRAKIIGHGPGAIRHCVFSTGPFVEPIEVWDEPRLLKFSVTENPEPMQEWTPYREIHPAHLEGYLQSQAGQFRLEPLPDGQTRLEGTTWYHHHLWPARYWQLWSDSIIHTIHRRVLLHVKSLSETSAQPEPLNRHP